MASSDGTSNPDLSSDPSLSTIRNSKIFDSSRKRALDSTGRLDDPNNGKRQATQADALHDDIAQIQSDEEDELEKEENHEEKEKQVVEEENHDTMPYLEDRSNSPTPVILCTVGT